MSERCRSLEKVCRRASDGTLWRPSAPDGYTEGHALGDLLACSKPKWYFRGVRRVRRRWWFDYWEDTGDAWEPVHGSYFDVLTEAEALARFNWSSPRRRP